jgi:hypothetical protein
MNFIRWSHFLKNKRRIPWLGLVWLGLITAWLGVSCGPSGSGMGKLEVQVWDHREAIADFKELRLTFSGLAIHPAGAPRTEGWLELQPAVQELDLTRYVDGQEAMIVQATVASGSYNAVRLVVDRASGLLVDGRPVEVKVSFETAALEFQVRDDQTTVLGLDLAVFDLSDHPGQDYELHLREAVVK